MSVFQRCFFRLYPSKPKETDTLEGDDLRFVLKVCTILNAIFFLASLTTIGFVAMLQNIAFGFWSYSCFLTLKEWQVIIYIIGLFFGIAHGIFSIFQYSQLRLLFFILHLIYLSFALYFTVRAYKNFRVTGGIHGKLGRPKPNLG